MRHKEDISNLKVLEANVQYIDIKLILKSIEICFW